MVALDLHSMSKAELLQLAVDTGVEGASEMTKAKLLETLLAQQGDDPVVVDEAGEPVEKAKKAKPTLAQQIETLKAENDADAG